MIQSDSNELYTNPHVLTCVVLYGQSPLESMTCNTLLNRYSHALIIDNSPTPIKEIDSLPSNWRYVNFADNPGLSFAYNYAAQYGIEHGFNWLLLADQDTTFPPEYIRSFSEASSRHPDIKLFCPSVMIDNNLQMSPVPLRHYMPRPIAGPAFTGEEVEISRFAIINSGLIVEIKAFLDAGGYNQNVFLDYSDFQFIERFSKFYPKAYVMKTKCSQNYSDQTETAKQKLRRFRLFCQSVRNFKASKRSNEFFVLLAVLKRTLSLCSRYKTLDPLVIFYSNYICSSTRK